jgi:hypothetical protein
LTNGQCFWLSTLSDLFVGNFGSAQMSRLIAGVAAVLLAALGGHALAVGLADHEAMCADLGFKKRTPAYGECVLELDRRASNEKGKAVQQVRQQEQQRGDGTPEHQTCNRFGFVVGTSPYADCRLKIDIAKQDQERKQADYEAEQRRYEAEQRRYDERVAAYEREKEKRSSLALMKFGFALMGGTSPNASENFANAGRESLGMAPVPPTRPQFQNFSITDPSGRRTNCTALGNNINCF